MMRKHPDAIALIVIGCFVLASVGVDGALQRLEREQFRIRPLVFQGDSLGAILSKLCQ